MWLQVTWHHYFCKSRPHGQCHCFTVVRVGKIATLSMIIMNFDRKKVSLFCTSDHENKLPPQRKMYLTFRLRNTGRYERIRIVLYSSLLEYMSQYIFQVIAKELWSMVELFTCKYKITSIMRENCAQSQFISSNKFTVYWWFRIMQKKTCPTYGI